MRSLPVRLHAVFPALALVVSGCVSTPDAPDDAVNDEMHVTNSFRSARVREIVDGYSDKRVLFVFDIDNTVLESPPGQFLGSAQWYDWQRKLPDDDARKVDCLLEVSGAAYHIAHLVPTEGGYAASFIAGLQSSGHDVIALTARSPQFRYPTERELLRHGIDFAKAVPNGFAGIPGYYFPDASPDIPAPRNASYQNGIVMLAGQHKGAALADLLDRIGAASAYDVIVFFDDDEKNTDAMFERFSQDRRRAVIFHYTAVDTDLGQYDLSKTVAGQEAIAKAYAQFVQVEGCDI
jgi:hypothetical protein